MGSLPARGDSYLQSWLSPQPQRGRHPRGRGPGRLCLQGTGPGAGGRGRSRSLWEPEASRGEASPAGVRVPRGCSTLGRPRDEGQSIPARARTAAAPQPRGRGGLWDLGRQAAQGRGQSSLWVGPVHQECVSPDPSPPALPPAPGLRAQHPFVFSQWGSSWGASRSGEPLAALPRAPKGNDSLLHDFPASPGANWGGCL